MVVDFECAGLAATINNVNYITVLTILVGSTFTDGHYAPAESVTIYGSSSIRKLRDALTTHLEAQGEG